MLNCEARNIYMATRDYPSVLIPRLYGFGLFTNQRYAPRLAPARPPLTVLCGLHTLTSFLGGRAAYHVFDDSYSPLFASDKPPIRL